MTEEHQDFERAWWGDCANTFREEQKQTVYAQHMGLELIERDGKWPVIDLEGRSVVDIGGGPSSLLLKCMGRAAGSAVVDPCRYPDWTLDRYFLAGIDHYQVRAEAFRTTGKWDEAWIYNVLEHVDDPALVIQRAWEAADCIRIFEWLDNAPREGHPQTLTMFELTDWLDVGLGKPATYSVRQAGVTFFGDEATGMFGRALHGVWAK